MKQIYIGSQNPAKINSVKNVFPDFSVEGVMVESKVSAQPFSDEETMEGAINRARECAKMKKSVFGLGLEGGVMEIEDELYLCNWGALIDTQENLYMASGARIPLPDKIKNELEKGRELGDVMDEYAEKQEIRKREGAIGIFTNAAINREEMFVHIVKLLKGQYEFYNN
ncbi:DUF84 family protein [Thalassobacillus pellis]|uniref:DUF84 family protein n=1 Tax=Thalassobacillus pellis TaxID=748008 RepID=UPI0019615BE6|nr:DUF84 family protein [Thalassobacillus pellis]MBM7554922.1 inosine/xanthosine triphosphatase [Thalassobacillus pellis]